MKNLPALILTFAIISGQLIKVPLFNKSGPTLLDFTILGLNIVGLYKIKFKFPKPPLYIKIAFVFVLIATLSLTITPLNLSQQELLASFSYTVRFLSFVLFGWLIYSNVFPILLRNVSKILVFSGLSLSILGLLQLIFIPSLQFLSKDGWDAHEFRTVSTFWDPNFAGAFFVLTLVILAQQWFKNEKGKILFFFTAAYFALLTTYSRGSYLMFGVSFVLLTILNRSLKLGILTAVCIFGLYLGYSNYLNSSEQPRSDMKATSAQTRVDSWQTGWAVFNRSPLFGIGHNAYRYGLREFGLASNEIISGRGAASNHSSLLHTAATTGIVGFAVFITFLGAIFWASWKSYLAKDFWGPVFLAAMSGILAHSFFANSLFYPSLLIWLILAAAKLKHL